MLHPLHADPGIGVNTPLARAVSRTATNLAAQDYGYWLDRAFSGRLEGIPGGKARRYVDELIYRIMSVEPYDMAFIGLDARAVQNLRHALFENTHSLKARTVDGLGASSYIAAFVRIVGFEFLFNEPPVNVVVGLFYSFVIRHSGLTIMLGGCRWVLDQSLGDHVERDIRKYFVFLSAFFTEYPRSPTLAKTLAISKAYWNSEEYSLSEEEFNERSREYPVPDDVCYQQDDVVQFSH